MKPMTYNDRRKAINKYKRDEYAYLRRDLFLAIGCGFAIVFFGVIAIGAVLNSAEEIDRIGTELAKFVFNHYRFFVSGLIMLVLAATWWYVVKKSR